MAEGRKTGGRKKGTPNKMTAQLKEMILTALDNAGGVTYLEDAARSHPAAFLTLIGKVLPMTLENPTDANGNTVAFHVIQRTIVEPKR